MSNTFRNVSRTDGGSFYDKNKKMQLPAIKDYRSVPKGQELRQASLVSEEMNSAGFSTPNIIKQKFENSSGDDVECLFLAQIPLRRFEPKNSEENIGYKESPTFKQLESYNRKRLKTLQRSNRAFFRERERSGN